MNFLLLTVITISNIQNNKVAIGILKSIGVNHWQMTKVYIYENFIVIFSSNFIGFTVGMLITFIF